MKGKISRIIRERGFGFIAVEDGKDIFFHYSGLSGGNFDSLVEGVSVEFDSEMGPKGPRAVNVKVESSTENKQGGEVMQAYCVKCRAKKEMNNPRPITMKNGKPATQGTCPSCGTKMFRIGKS